METGVGINHTKDRLTRRTRKTCNISCTPLFSKVFEYFVLQRLKEEAAPSRSQFGGLQGVSTNHYLAHAWTKILEDLDEENSACALISVDFAKAFNAMGHEHCLRVLHEMMVGQHTIAMTRAFLTDRRMSFYVGNEWSSERKLKGGAPQGTLLGNYLFILATDNLEARNGMLTLGPAVSHGEQEKDGSGSDIRDEHGQDEENLDSELGELSGYSREVSFPDGGVHPFGTSTPTRSRSGGPRYAEADQGDENDSFQYFRELRKPFNRLEDTRYDLSTNTLDASDMNAEQPAKPNWKQLDSDTMKYIDDFLSTEHLALTGAYNIFSTNKPEAVLHAKRCQEFFVAVKKNAENVGMKVNDQKTQLLCIDFVHGRDVSAYICLTSNEKIKSQETLKQLGFVFGKRPNMDAHYEHMCLKYRKRLWYLRHLKSAGIGKDDLTVMYKCFLLSVLDYSSVVYGCMITSEQAHGLEMLQSAVLKIIYGMKKSYFQLLEESGVETLAERRQKLTDSFIVKTAQNEHFKEQWFSTREFTHHVLRTEKIYEEKFARTDRLYRSPLYMYRRRLNEIYIHRLNKNN